MPLFPGWRKWSTLGGDLKSTLRYFEQLTGETLNPRENDLSLRPLRPVVFGMFLSSVQLLCASVLRSHSSRSNVVEWSQIAVRDAPATNSLPEIVIYTERLFRIAWQTV